MAAANLYQIPFSRKSISISTSGAKTATYTENATISEIDLQPATTEVSQLFEAEKAEITYQCFVSGSSHDIKNGDRCKDPLASPAPSNPDLEVIRLQKWPATGGLPPHTQFLLKKVI